MGSFTHSSESNEKHKKCVIAWLSQRSNGGIIRPISQM